MTFPATDDKRNAEYRRRHAIFDLGWEARVAGKQAADNPYGPALLPKACRDDAELWANGWHSADEWLALGVSNWCLEGAAVQCIEHKVLSGPSFTGRKGVIKTVHRWGLLGYVTVVFPRVGRQKHDRETFFDLRRAGQLVPVDGL